MRILALDTSAKTGSVALCDDDSLLVEMTLEMNRTHSERLLVALDAALKTIDVPLDSVELVATSVGPGPFTGIRMGVTTAKALAFSRGIPVVGVPTLDAIAFSYRYRLGELCVLLDARKDEVYAAQYTSNGDGDVQRRGEIRCLPLEGVLAEVERPTLFVGDAVERYRVRIAERLGDRALLGDEEAGICRATNVARLGRRLYEASEKSPEGVHLLAPLYIRRPEAETKIS